jgi:hypothetical protein
VTEPTDAEVATELEAQVRAYADGWDNYRARRAKLARLFAIPYSILALVTGIAMAKVFDHGMRATFITLAVGYSGAVFLPVFESALLLRSVSPRAVNGRRDKDGETP